MKKDTNEPIVASDAGPAKDQPTTSKGPDAAKPKLASEEAVPPTDEEKKAAALRAKHIVKQAPKHVDTTKADPRYAGNYRVTHGAVHFGPGVAAHKGAHVNLSAEDAEKMLAAGTIEPLPGQWSPEAVEEPMDEEPELDDEP